jgi:hypothetical protein
MISRTAHRSTFGSLVLFGVTALAAGCSSSKHADVDSAGPLRPGVDDSSQAYQGTPDADESAFWVAVRNGDDTGRASALTKLQADVTDDPTNGYSEFLIGASSFMPPTSQVEALANGTAPGPFMPSPAPAVPYFKAALSHLTDRFYLGFDGALLGETELAGGDPTDGLPTLQTAAQNNPAASTFIKVIGDLEQGSASTGLTDMYMLFDFCNGGAVDQSGADAMAYVGKMNAGALVHRECYSGYYAPHGSPGELLVMAELEALNGDTTAANAWLAAVQSATDYATWPLKPYVERRLSGAQAVSGQTVALIAATCGTCHLNAMP